jgi:hypothetical protein
MKIPKLTAEVSIGGAAGTYRSAPHASGQATLVPMATLACLSQCVGPATAEYCAARCTGANDTAACWQQCTGTDNPSCIQACFRS